MKFLHETPPKIAGCNDDERARKEAHVKHSEMMRPHIDKLSEKNGGFRQWSATAGCEIVEASIKIPCRSGLFREWGIIKAEDKMEFSLPDDLSDIQIYVSFPVALLHEDIKRPTETNEFGCLVLEQDDILRIVSKDIPVVLFFHGGGLTLGNPSSSEGIDLMHAAMKETPVNTTVIYASIKYSLAPERPFPAAPLEACSAVSHFLDHGFKLHLSGVSAGGYLALVAGLEASRVHPKKANLLSILACCPMLSPASDSISFYQNKTSSHFVPVEFLRWSYRVYLDLPDDDDAEETIDDKSLSTILGRNSTRAAWSRSRWRNSSLRRLVEPAVDLPSNLSLKIILTTNRADPLHADGIAMFEKLQAAGANVTHHDHGGSHWFGSILDKVAYKNLALAWKEIIFGGAG